MPRSSGYLRRLGLVLLLGAAIVGLARSSARAECVFGFGCAAPTLSTAPAHNPPSLYNMGARRVHAAPRHAGAGLAGVYAPLAAKAREIVADCGSRVISGVRHTFIAGTHIRSEHWTGHAVDIAGNPSCIYRHLAGWPGGYSIDYAAVRHVHFSLGGPEDGKRFAHNRHTRTRFAAHRHRRIA